MKGEKITRNWNDNVKNELSTYKLELLYSKNCWVEREREEEEEKLDKTDIFNEWIKDIY